MTYVPIPLPNRVEIQKNEVMKVVNDYYDRNTPNLDEVKHYHYAILEELFDI